jgi:hypothetical protein
MVLSQLNGNRKPEFTFILAIIIFSAYVVFFGVVMYRNQPNESDGMKTITATFGVIVAAVVGYYFGQRPSEAADQRAQEAVGQKVQSETKLNTETKLDVEHLESDITKHRQHRGVDNNMSDQLTQMLRRYEYE